MKPLRENKQFMAFVDAIHPGPRGEEAQRAFEKREVERLTEKFASKGYSGDFFSPENKRATLSEHLENIIATHNAFDIPPRLGEMSWKDEIIRNFKKDFNIGRPVYKLSTPLEQAANGDWKNMHVALQYEKSSGFTLRQLTFSNIDATTSEAHSKEKVLRYPVKIPDIAFAKKMLDLLKQEPKQQKKRLQQRIK